MKSLSKFLASKGVWLSIIITLVYGILVFCIYFTGYKPLPNRLTDLPITIVSDNEKNNQLSRQLKKSLNSFSTIKQTKSLDNARNDLKNRRTYMVICIPNNFSQRVQANQPTSLDFYVNEANQPLIVTGLKNIANNIGASVNNQVSIQKGKALLGKSIANQLQKENQGIIQQAQAQIASLPLQQQAAAKIQLEHQQNQQRAQITKQVNKAYVGVNNSVTTNIHRINKVKSGINNSMAPFFISLAAYLSALIGALVLYGTYVKFSKQVGRYKSFIFLEISMILLSLFGGLVVAATVITFTTGDWGNLSGVWFVHSLEIFGAYNLNTVFILLLGQIGASINILLTMIQVVAGAGMIPTQIMSPFFKLIHHASPMFYSIMSDYDLLYGNNTSLWKEAFIVALCYIIINLIIVSLRKKQPMLDFSKLA